MSSYNTNPPNIGTLRSRDPTVAASLASSKVLRNTYRLLGMTLIFSAAVAAASASLGLPYPGLLVTLAGYFGLLFLTTKLRNSGWGLVSVFALTGFMGYTLGPLLDRVFRPVGLCAVEHCTGYQSLGQLSHGGHSHGFLSGSRSDFYEHSGAVPRCIRDVCAVDVGTDYV
jgi:modulator of FtsH protease